MRRYHADDRFVVAAREKRIADIEAVFLLPSFVRNEARDVVPLVLSESRKVIRGRARWDHFYVRFCENFTFACKCMQRRLSFRIVWIERIFFLYLIVEPDHAVTDLRPSIFDKVI